MSRVRERVVTYSDDKGMFHHMVVYELVLDEPMRILSIDGRIPVEPEPEEPKDGPR